MEKKKEVIYEDIDKSDLAKLTKKVYKSRVNNLFKAKGFPDNILEVVEELNPNDNLNSEVNIVSNILAITNISKTFKKLFDDDDLGSLRLLYDKLATVQKSKDPIETRDNDVTWAYLQSLEKNLEKPNIKGDDRLLFHLYVDPGIGFVPRNDFAQMKLVDDMDDADNEEYNYYVRDKKTMLFNEYKTSKRYGQIKVKVSPELAKYIPVDQDWLFEQGGEPMKDNSIGKKIARAFKRLSGGKDITLVTLRRAFATHMQDLPDDERRKLALKMGHSSMTNKSYSHNKEDDELDERVKELE